MKRFGIYIGLTILLCGLGYLLRYPPLIIDHVIEDDQTMVYLGYYPNSASSNETRVIDGYDSWVNNGQTIIIGTPIDYAYYQNTMVLTIDIDTIIKDDTGLTSDDQIFVTCDYGFSDQPAFSISGLINLPLKDQRYGFSLELIEPIKSIYGLTTTDFGIIPFNTSQFIYNDARGKNVYTLGDIREYGIVIPSSQQDDVGVVGYVATIEQIVEGLEGIR